MAAPAQELEALVRDELRGPVTELVRRLVPELVREQLNGAGHADMGTAPELEPERDTPRALSAVRTCRVCGETKPSSEFEAHRHVCRPCRRDQANRRRPAVATGATETTEEEPPRPEPL